MTEMGSSSALPPSLWIATRMSMSPMNGCSASPSSTRRGSSWTNGEQPGPADGQFNRPSGLAFDKEDNLYLVDSANHRVQIFTKEGKFLDKFGGFGGAEGQFHMPWGIAIDRKGEVYVADWRNDRVQKFSPGAKFLGAFGSSGNLAGQFNRPTGVAVDILTGISTWRTG